ncbi:MAG: hypothetical protein K2X94_04225 [Amoebophilaceae bacterium]|nr:hypothetical protein [Amoebophilaceae bacterium]
MFLATICTWLLLTACVGQGESLSQKTISNTTNQQNVLSTQQLKSSDVEWLIDNESRISSIHDMSWHLVTLKLIESSADGGSVPVIGLSASIKSNHTRQAVSKFVM